MAKEVATIAGVLNGVKRIKSNHSPLTFVNFYVEQIKCKSFGSCADRILTLPQNVKVQISGHYTNSQKGWGIEFVAETTDILAGGPPVRECQSKSAAKEANVKLLKDCVTLTATKIENLHRIGTSSGRSFVNFIAGPHNCKSFGITAETLLEMVKQSGGEHPSLVLKGYFSNSARYGEEFVCENVTWRLPAVEVVTQASTSTMPSHPVHFPPPLVSDADLEAHAKRAQERRAAEEAKDYEKSFAVYSHENDFVLRGIRCDYGTTAAQIRAIDAILAQRKTGSGSQAHPQLEEVLSSSGSTSATGQ